MEKSTAKNGHSAVSVRQTSPAAQSQNKEKDGRQITLVPNILDVVPYPLGYEGTADEEGLKKRRTYRNGT